MWSTKRVGTKIVNREGREVYIQLGVRALNSSTRTEVFKSRKGSYSVRTFLGSTEHKVTSMLRMEFKRRFPKLFKETNELF